MYAAAADVYRSVCERYECDTRCETAREVLVLKGDVRCIALCRSWCGWECSCFVRGSVSGGNIGLQVCKNGNLVNSNAVTH